MRFVVTVMVRDEIDIIAAFVEHTLAQQPDLIIATDNGSVDGTTEVLQAYADAGRIELHHDPEHRKQQGAVVTAMARRAHVVHGADWVVNADADEFWSPVDRTLTLRDALERIPLELNSFRVPVTNLVGRPARFGGGFGRLVWRDRRSEEQLRESGVYAQPTDNEVPRGHPELKVALGNHKTSMVSTGRPDPALALEALHLPWRSWHQFEQKVRNAGRAYEADPRLTPSRNHHGLNDYRRFQAGRLLPSYLLRQPTGTELKAGEAAGWFVRDEWLRDTLHGLVDRAVRPDLLAPLLDDRGDEPFDDAEIESGAVLARQFLEVERERIAAEMRADAADRLLDERTRELAARTAEFEASTRELTAARAALRARAEQSVAEDARAVVRRAVRGAQRRVRRR